MQKTLEPSNARRRVRVPRLIVAFMLSVSVCVCVAQGQAERGDATPKKAADEKKAAADKAKDAKNKAEQKKAQVKAGAKKVVVAATAEEAEDQTNNGVALDTDSIVNEKIEKARVFLNDERYNDAATVLQNVLNESSGSMTTSNGRVYEPVGRAVERLLARLSPQALTVYRLAADGEAQGVLNAASESKREDALADVVRRFFVSSVGDNAAYELACYKLDRHDFLAARRLLHKVLNDHPDPDVPRGQVLIRLAVAAARGGDREGAQWALDELERLNPSEPTRQTRAIVAEHVKAIAAAGPKFTAGGDGWRMPLGGPRRTGVMHDLPADLARDGSLWTRRWNHAFKPDESRAKTTRVYGQRRGPQTRAQLVGRWERNQWRPTGKLLMVDGRIYYKTHHGVRCVDPTTGEVVWETEEPKPTKTSSSSYYSGYYGAMAAPAWPATTREISLFGDHVSKTMSMSAGLILQIEGRWQASTRGGNVRVVVVNGRVIRQPVSTTLRALDVKTGKPQWQFPLIDEKSGKPIDSTLDGSKVLAAPTPVGDRLLTPVITKTDASLWLYALNPKDGSVLWRTFLCADTGANNARWANVGITVEGGEAYVATGYGVVFALDAADGAVRWASTYERQKRSGTQYSYNRQVLPDVVGFDDDTAVAVGDVLVVAPSDSEKLMGIDRASGEVKYSIESKGMRYCLGADTGGVFIGGPESVTRYDAQSGKATWTQKVKTSFGRAALTPEAIYLPVGQEIRLLDPKTGKPMRKLVIDTGETSTEPVAGDVPVGNVYVDGDRLLIHGQERVYSLSRIDKTLDALAKQIEKNEALAMLERARIRRRMGDPDAALDDLRMARKAAKNDDTRDHATSAMVDTLLGIGAAKANRADVVLKEAEDIARETSHLSRVLLAKAQRYSDVGKIELAIQTYLSISAKPSDVLVPIGYDGGRIEANPVEVARRGLRSLIAAHGQAARDLLQKRGEAAMAQTDDLLDDDKWAQVSGDFEKLKKEADRLREEATTAAKAPKRITLQLIGDKKRVGFLEKVLAGAIEQNGNDSDEAKRAEVELADSKNRVAETQARLDKSLAKHKQTLAERDKAVAALRPAQTEHDRLAAVRENLSGHLLNVARTYRGTPVARRALRAAVERLEKQGKPEEAELLLRSTVASNDPLASSEAAADLAALYERQKWHNLAAQTWRELAQRHPDQAIRIDGQAVVVKDAAAGIVDRLTKAAPKPREATPSPPYKRLWHIPRSSGSSVAQASLGSEDMSPFLRRHMMLIGVGNKHIVLRDLHTGKDTWQFDPGGGGSSSRSGSSYRLYRNILFPSGQLMRVGHVALMPTQNRTRAVSLLTGKTIWDFNPNEGDNNNSSSMWSSYSYYARMTGVHRVDNDATVLAYVAEASGNVVSKVRAIDAVTGKVKWERQFDKDSIVGLSVAAGYVNLVIDPNELLVCDRETGATVSRVSLKDQLVTTSYYRRTPLLWTADSVMYMTNKGLARRELPSGKLLSQQVLKAKGEAQAAVNAQPYYFNLYEHGKRFVTLYVYRRGGQPLYAVVDRVKGKLVGAYSTAAAGHSVSQIGLNKDASLVHLIGIDAKKRLKATTLNTQSGEKISQIDLGETNYGKVAEGGMSSGARIIPVHARDPKPTKENNRTVYLTNITFFDRESGKVLENAKLPVPRADGKVNSFSAMAVRDGVLVVFSSYDGIMAFGHGESKAQAGDAWGNKPEQSKTSEKPRLVPVPLPAGAARPAPARAEPQPAARAILQRLFKPKDNVKKIEIRAGKVVVEAVQPKAKQDQGKAVAKDPKAADGDAKPKADKPDAPEKEAKPEAAKPDKKPAATEPADKPATKKGTDAPAIKKSSGPKP